MASSRSLVFGALLVAAILGAGPASADIASTPDKTWVVPSVAAIERAGDTVYLGGTFTRIGPRTGSGVPTSAATGEVDPSFPEIAGTQGPRVEAAIPDGSGGWFIGGRFGLVGGVPRSNLVHVRADDSVDPDFNPAPDGPISDMALVGETLYLAGGFQSISGANRPVLAAVDRRTGSLLAWNPAPQGTHGEGTPVELAVLGDTVYVGGDFTAIGGAAHVGMAAVDAISGAAKPWASDITASYGASPLIEEVEAVGDRVYAGGRFTTAGGEARNGVAAFGLDGAVLPWNPQPDAAAAIYAIAVSGTSVYIGGDFDSIGGAARDGLAAVDAATAAATPWDPETRDFAEVQDIATAGAVVYVAGFFNQIGGRAGGRAFAALDQASGRATPWDPVVVLPVGIVDGRVVVPAGDEVFAGGMFPSLGAHARSGLAALDVRSGNPLPFNPEIRVGDGPGYVGSMARLGNRLYVAGFFDSIDGVARDGLAAFDLTTGRLTDWAPELSSEEGPAGAGPLAVTADAVYLGGTFDHVGGQPRRWLAAVDPVSGAPTRFDPQLDGPATVAEAAEPYIYVGGPFSSAGGASRAGLALLRADDGSATCWDPGKVDRADGIWAIEAAGDRAYVGGVFGEIGGRPRKGLAALDSSTGAVLPWDPRLDGYNPYVTAIEAAGPVVYVGGAFDTVGGAERFDLAAISRTSASATAFDPGLSGSDQFFPAGHSAGISDLLVADDGTLHLGGNYDEFRTAWASGYAQFRGGPTTEALPVPKPDCGPPRIRVSVRTRSLNRALRRGIAVRLSASRRGTVRLRLAVSSAEARRLGLPIRPGRATKVLATRRLRVPESGARETRLVLSRQLRRRLSEARRLRASLTARLDTRTGRGVDRVGLVLRRAVRRSGAT